MKFLVVIFAFIAAAAAQLITPWGLPARTVAAPLMTPYVSGPATYGAPVYSHSYAAGPTVAVQTGMKMMHTYEPVEQHGYEIRY